MQKSDEYYLKKAINEAKKAYKNNDIPIGAIIYSKDEDKIVARAYNKKDKSNIVTDHAEIIAVEKANKKLQNWRLINTVLYTTLEPCEMCKEVLKEAKVEKVIYGAKGKKKTTEKNFVQIKNKQLIEECEKMIKDKFEEIRKK